MRKQRPRKLNHQGKQLTTQLELKPKPLRDYIFSDMIYDFQFKKNYFRKSA
jgi:hypothetical protein